MAWFCHGLEERLRRGATSREAASAALQEIAKHRAVLGGLLDEPEAALAALRGLPAIESLRALGYVVVEAQDGGQAVRRATKLMPDVVIIDVSLPVLDGIEAIRRIRASGGSKNPYVIVMSGQLDARTRQLAFEAGCDQYIVKPCGIDVLAAAVRAYFLKRDGRQ